MMKGENMKAIISKSKVAMLLVVLSFNTFAQTPQTTKIVSKAKESFLICLQSGHNGIVESSIFYSIELKDRYPQEDYKKIIDKLNELAIESNSPAVRYKAQLASLYFNFYQDFSDIKIVDKDNPDTFFRQITDRIEKLPLASN